MSTIKKPTEELKQAFGDFFHLSQDNNVLDSKTTLLIQLAASMALGCYP